MRTKILVPGHLYRVPYLEHSGYLLVRFIRRSSDMVSHPLEWSGINTQELIRVLIDRTEYLNALGPCEESENAIYWLTMALYEYEARAWRRKQQKLNKRADAQADVDRVNSTREFYRDVPFTPQEILDMRVGPDGHVIIEGNHG